MQTLAGGWTFFSQTPESKLWFLIFQLNVFGKVISLVTPPSLAAKPGRSSPPGPLWAAPGRYGPPQAGRVSLALDPDRAGPSGAKAGPGGTERGRARRGRAGLGGLGAATAKRGCGLVGRGRVGPS